MCIRDRGVLIGIVDTGIDFTHKAFVAADGTSRIVSIWDQSVEEGVGNENFPYGRMYSREQLNQALSSKNPFEIVPSQEDVYKRQIKNSLAGRRKMPRFMQNPYFCRNREK